jgi:hypothetical protein
MAAPAIAAATRTGGRSNSETERACRVFEKLLEDGPQSTPVIWETGKSQGFSDRDQRRARSLLAIRSKRVGNGHEHRAYWYLKDQELPSDVVREEPEADLSFWLDPLIAAYPAATPLDEGREAVEPW